MSRARPPAEPPHTQTRERGAPSTSSSAGEAGLRGTAGDCEGIVMDVCVYNKQCLAWTLLVALRASGHNWPIVA